MSKFSYHDVTVYCNNIKYVISDNYAYFLTCTKCGGWELWYKWNGTESLLGSEFGNEPFCITVGNIAIVGKIPDENLSDEQYC